MYDARGPEETVDIKQASHYCRRNPETVRRWVWTGKLPAQKVGNQLFIRKEDLVQFCRESGIAYQTGPEKTETSLEEIRKTGADIHTRIRQGYNAEWETASLREEREEMNGEDFLEKARSVRESIHARTGRVFNAENMIRELRDERDGQTE